MSKDLIIAVCFLAGLCFGSFANVLILRSRSGESLWLRSRCPNCHKEIRWYDLAPVLSFFMLGGRCRYCGGSISLQYPAIELLCAVLFAAAGAVAWPDRYFGMYLCGLVFWGIVIAAGDYLFLEIDDRHLIGLALWSFLFHWTHGSLRAAALGGALGLLLAVVIAAVGYIRYRSIAFGSGDILLAGVIGLVAGWPSVLPVLMVAVFLHAMGGILLVLWRFFRREGSFGQLMASCILPFAPALVISSFIIVGLRVMGRFIPGV